jgi:hypothetical protein
MEYPVMEQPPLSSGGVQTQQRVIDLMNEVMEQPPSSSAGVQTQQGLIDLMSEVIKVDLS